MAFIIVGLVATMILAIPGSKKDEFVKVKTEPPKVRLIAYNTSGDDDINALLSPTLVALPSRSIADATGKKAPELEPPLTPPEMPPHYTEFLQPGLIDINTLLAGDAVTNMIAPRKFSPRPKTSSPFQYHSRKQTNRLIIRVSESLKDKVELSHFNPEQLLVTGIITNNTTMFVRFDEHGRVQSAIPEPIPGNTNAHRELLKQTRLCSLTGKNSNLVGRIFFRIINEQQ